MFRFQTLLAAAECGLPVDRKKQAEQVRPVAWVRFGAVVGRVAGRIMGEVDEALRLHLQL